jgi:ribosomal protein S27AE
MLGAEVTVLAFGLELKQEEKKKPLKTRRSPRCGDGSLVAR